MHPDGEMHVGLTVNEMHFRLLVARRGPPRDLDADAQRGGGTGVDGHARRHAHGDTLAGRH